MNIEEVLKNSTVHWELNNGAHICRATILFSGAVVVSDESLYQDPVNSRSEIERKVRKDLAHFICDVPTRQKVFGIARQRVIDLMNPEMYTAMSNWACGEEFTWK